MYHGFLIHSSADGQGPDFKGFLKVCCQRNSKEGPGSQPLLCAHPLIAGGSAFFLRENTSSEDIQGLRVLPLAPACGRVTFGVWGDERRVSTGPCFSGGGANVHLGQI